MKKMFRVYGLRVLPVRSSPWGVFLFGAASLSLLCAVSPPQAHARQRHAHDGHAAAGKARLTIPDVEVLDQDGRRVRFYSDLIKGRVVVVNFFFTSCTFVCAMQGRTLAKFQAALGGRLGQDVFFLSVSKDPRTDTPARLKQWGADYGHGPGWALVTGEKSVMAKLVRDFTGGGLGREMHAPFLLIGNDRTGVWVEADSFATTDELVKLIDGIAQSPATSDR